MGRISESPSIKRKPRYFFVKATIGHDATAPSSDTGPGLLTWGHDLEVAGDSWGPSDELLDTSYDDVLEPSG